MMSFQIGQRQIVAALALAGALLLVGVGYAVGTGRGGQTGATPAPVTQRADRDCDRVIQLTETLATERAEWRAERAAYQEQLSAAGAALRNYEAHVRRLESEQAHERAIAAEYARTHP